MDSLTKALMIISISGVVSYLNYLAYMRSGIKLHALFFAICGANAVSTMLIYILRSIS